MISFNSSWIALLNDRKILIKIGIFAKLWTNKPSCYNLVRNQMIQQFISFDRVDPEQSNDTYITKFKDVQIRIGDKQFNSAIHKHKSPSAARIEMTLDEQQNPDLTAPKDLEGIELEIVYGIGEDCENPHCRNHGTPHIHWMYSLSNKKDEKKVTVKIPKMENAPTEEEKEILKGIFIGGHRFKLEVLSNGNAEIKFQKSDLINFRV